MKKILFLELIILIICLMVLYFFGFKMFLVFAGGYLLGHIIFIIQYFEVLRKFRKEKEGVK